MLLLLGLSSLPGCHSLALMPGPKADTLEITCKLDKTVYQPGEAVLATVTLTSNSHKPIRLQELNAKSALFYFGRLSDPERMERSAVASKDEALDRSEELDPGQKHERTWVLTRLTEFNGPLTAQVHYTPGAAGKDIPLKIYSNVMHYEVKGSRLFERDPAGYITKRQAFKQAKAVAGGDFEPAEAILITDEAGFDKWWVNLTSRSNAATRKSYFVNPYKGNIWRQAEPFDPKMAQDPRFKRPAGLPAMPMPSLAVGKK